MLGTGCTNGFGVLSVMCARPRSAQLETARRNVLYPMASIDEEKGLKNLQGVLDVVYSRVSDFPFPAIS